MLIWKQCKPPKRCRRFRRLSHLDGGKKATEFVLGGLQGGWMLRGDDTFFSFYIFSKSEIDIKHRPLNEVTPSFGWFSFTVLFFW